MRKLRRKEERRKEERGKAKEKLKTNPPLRAPLNFT